MTPERWSGYLLIDFRRPAIASSRNAKRAAYMAMQGEDTTSRCPPPFFMRPSVPRRPALPRAAVPASSPTRTSRGSSGCGLAPADPGLHRLLGHELRPGEQRLLRLRGLVVGAVAVPVDLHGCVSVPVGVLGVGGDQLNRRPDADGVVVAVPVGLDRIRLDFDRPSSRRPPAALRPRFRRSWPGRTPPPSSRPRSPPRHR